MFTVGKAIRKRRCHACSRVIPKNTFHVANTFTRYQNQTHRHNYCSLCVLSLQFHDEMLEDENKYVKGMIKKCARESIAQGYCCEHKKFSDFCNGCPKTLDCFTTLNARRK